MPQTMTYTGELTITTCWCGIRLAIPANLYRKAQSDSHFAVFCPLGHEFVYSKNEAERERERANEAERRLRMQRAATQAARDQAEAAERSARAYKGHVTRLRNRIADGICPVDGCRRNFVAVRAHIERMHPDWASAHPEVFDG